MDRPFPHRLIFWAALSILAAFLPWAEVSQRLGEGLFSLVTASETLTGWRGTLTILHVIVPNWFPVVAVLAAVIYAWIGGERSAARALIVTAGYAIIHLAVLWVTVINNSGTLGIGVILGGAAYVALLMQGLRATRKPAP